MARVETTEAPQNEYLSYENLIGSLEGQKIESVKVGNYCSTIFTIKLTLENGKVIELKAGGEQFDQYSSTPCIRAYTIKT